MAGCLRISWAVSTHKPTLNNMLNVYKNPFAFRASERIESDEMFLELFSSEPLSHLETQNDKNVLWGTMTYILSSPGAGKTTLLRLFSPTVLQKIVEKFDKNDTYKRLKKLGVKDGDAINKCGVYLQMGRDYEFLEDDDLFEPVEQKRIFLSLLNARIVLATLKACKELAKISYNELSKIVYAPEEPFIEFGEFKAEYNGQELLNWAADQEKRICEFLDSFVVPEGGIKGNNSLFALSAMKAKWFTIDGHPLCDEFIFQIDDGHKLSDNQKKIIQKEVAEKRINATVWIAERLETLSTEDILQDNDIKGRDFQIIKLGTLSEKQFNSMTRAIATQRSEYSSAGIGLFTSLAASTKVNYKALYNEASKKYLERLAQMPNYDNYQECASMLEQVEPYERAVRSRAMLMHAARQSDIGNMRLFGYESVEMDSLLEPLYPYAVDLLPGENKKLPQYFGPQTLISLASSNIEQFLNLASELYDVLLAKKIMDSSNFELTAEEQNKVVQQFCKSRMNDIKRHHRGNKIYDFLMHVVNFCEKETFTPSYSYRTVSGFAVKEENSGRYSNDGFWFQDERYSELADILRDCLAYNLLEKAYIPQGKKGQMWTVYYINNWLCAYARLPLRRGGWRKLSLNQLTKWL